MWKKVIKGAAIAVFVVVAGSALAQGAARPSAEGHWQTIDDTSGKPRAIVRIYLVNGALQGDIEKVFYEPGEKKSGFCVQCPPPQRGKPVVGLTILWALRPDGSGRGYRNGHILDPANAAVYKCRMTLNENGNTRDVRGFVGYTGALGRTQTWHRI